MQHNFYQECNHPLSRQFWGNTATADVIMRGWIPEGFVSALYPGARTNPKKDLVTHVWSCFPVCAESVDDVIPSSTLVFVMAM